MIEWLEGVLKPDVHEVEGLAFGRLVVGGVGYGVFISCPTDGNARGVFGDDFSRALASSAGIRLELWIHEHRAGELVELYGFNSKDERELFRGLLKGERVGPKIAMRALSIGEDRLFQLAEGRRSDELADAIKGCGPVGGRELVSRLRKHFKLRGS